MRSQDKEEIKTEDKDKYFLQNNNHCALIYGVKSKVIDFRKENDFLYSAFSFVWGTHRENAQYFLLLESNLTENVHRYVRESFL